ncbi:MAG: ABC transporter permease [Hymenobacteraceae bacterium]|nr:ABC transporter permease [Hymenobacteraceae bacterium]
MLFLRLTFESLRFAVDALRTNLLRTVLSLLGVTVGIFAIIAVFTVVDSLETKIRASMNFLGRDVLYVQKWPWGFGGEYPWWKYFQRPEPSPREFRELERRLTGATALALLTGDDANTIKFGNSAVADVTVNGVTMEYNRITDFDLSAGRYFTPQEMESARNVAIIGAEVAEGLFPSREPLGQLVKLRGQRFQVIGVMARQGENMFGASSDQQLYVPFGAMSKMYTVGGITGLGVTVAVKGLREDTGLQELEYELRGTLRAVRGLRPRDDDSFSINRPELAADAISGLFGVIGVIGWVIGGFSILVGGFGIANIMFVSVKERTNLIGIQKSLGAKNYFILFQFLFEAVFLSLVGGLGGLVLVFGLTLVPQDSLALVLSPANVALGLGVSAVIGTLAGIVPAVMAANMDPVLAIRAK